VRGSIADFERELRDAVDLTSDRLPNKEFYLEARTPEEPDIFSILMKVVHPDEMVPSPRVFDWGPSPRQEMVHGAVRCLVFPHGGDELRVAIASHDGRADAYCAILAEELEERWLGSRRTRPREEELTSKHDVRADREVVSRRVVPPAEPIGRDTETEQRGGSLNEKQIDVTPEIRKRAELAAAEKARDPSLSYAGVAMRLTTALQKASKENTDLGIGDKESITIDDVRYCLGAMRRIEPGNPKWRWIRGDASYRR
jgi:hypothetical protein